MPRMTGGRAIVEAIDREGVENVFFVPGESLLTIMDGLYAHPRIRLVAARHEGGASYMALGYALASGRPGVCMAQRAPGTANLSIGLHCADQDSVPVVAFVSQVGTRGIGRESHQETDLVSMVRPHCKEVIELRTPERVGEMAQMAFRIAQEGRPGVVAVVMPDDILRPEVETEVAPGFHAARPGLPPDDAAEIVEAIRRAERPVLMAGGGVQRSGAWQELQQLAEAVGAPILNWRQSVIVDGHPAQVWVEGDASQACLDEADLFIVVGSRLNEDASLLHAVPPRGKPWIHIDLKPGTAYAPEAPMLAFAADARRALQALLGAAAAKPVDQARLEGRRRWTMEWHDAWREDSRTPEPHRSTPIHPEIVTRTMARVVPSNAAVSVDIGNFVFWLRRHWRAAEANTFYQSSAGSMGSGFSMAIGIQLAQPDRLVVAAAGDGGFMMSVSEIETAVRLQLPIIVVVFNNSQYGTIRWQQESQYPTRTIGTTYGGTDFAAVARAMGAHGERVQRPEDVEAAFRRAIAAKRTTVLDFVTDPNEIFPGVTIAQLRERARS